MEQAVIVHLRLSNRFGSSEEREAIVALEDQLTKAIQQADAGEFDGDEFGDGECVFYMYGPEADRLFAAVDPLLKSSTFRGYAIKRYGEAGDQNAPEVRVAF